MAHPVLYNWTHGFGKEDMGWEGGAHMVLLDLVPANLSSLVSAFLPLPWPSATAVCHSTLQLRQFLEHTPPTPPVHPVLCLLCAATNFNS